MRQRRRSNDGFQNFDVRVLSSRTFVTRRGTLPGCRNTKPQVSAHQLALAVFGATDDWYRPARKIAGCGSVGVVRFCANRQRMASTFRAVEIAHGR
jgi:hypothetical protein